MRKDLELLIILKKNFDTYFQTGICPVIFMIYIYNIISTDEYVRLKYIIRKNAPSECYSDAFFFPMGDYWQRVEFLDSLIKKLETAECPMDLPKESD